MNVERKRLDSRRTTDRPTVGHRSATLWAALLVAGPLGLWLTVAAQAQTPPWQQPPTAESFGDWASQAGPGSSCATCNGGSSEGDSCDGGCASGTCEGDAACGHSCGFFVAPHDYWIRTDALLWWTNGGNTPPLLTTSPNGTPQTQAGILNSPTTTILLGNQGLNDDFRLGGRVSFGTWLDACDGFGVEIVYLGLGQSIDSNTATSTGSPILARPFFDVDTGKEDAQLIAYPGTVQGTFSATSTSNFQAGELLTHWSIAREAGYRIELLGGYRFQRLTEGLDIVDSISTPGTTSRLLAQVSDEFHARNDFNGAEVGVTTAWHRCRWSLESTMKLALGSNHSQVDINGTTTSGTNVLTGGLLALPSNSGTHVANQFSAVPELGLTIGYDVNCRLRLVAGYSLIYWSNVARPGDQIDLNVSPSQFPPPSGTSDRPAYTQHNSDFWAQGVNLGLDFRF